MRNFILTTLCLCFAFLGEAQTWSEVGGLDGLAANHSIESICSDSSGFVYAIANFNSLSNSIVAKWDGNSWSELGGSNSLKNFLSNYTIASTSNNKSTICSDKFGNIYVSGNWGVVKWDGNTWTLLGGVINNFGGYLTTDSKGNVYNAWNFLNANGKYYVAVWNGLSWSELGGPNSLAANGGMLAICVDSKGNIYTAGGFTNVKGNKYVAKYDGTAWSEVGGLNNLAANDYIMSICTDTKDNLYASGRFNSNGQDYVAQFTGSKWNNIGYPNAMGRVQISCICSDSKGGICIDGGLLNLSGSFVGHYINGNWSSLGGTSLSANDGILTLASDLQGNIYAAGNFTNNSGHYYVATCSAANVGIQNERLISLQISPNPSSSELNIVNPFGPAAFSITTLTGQKITDGKLQAGTQSIDVSAFPNGIYFLQTATETYKFCVAH